jgi:CoA-transferase family III
VTSPHLPSLPLLDVETSRGKRTAQLDLNVPADAEKLRELLRDADVFLQSYSPGSLARRGFGHEDCAAIRPGIVYASLSGFSPCGPWQDVKSVRASLYPSKRHERTRFPSFIFGGSVNVRNNSSTPSSRRSADLMYKRPRRTQTTFAKRVGRKKLQSCRHTARCRCKRWITRRGTSSHSALLPRSAKPSPCVEPPPPPLSYNKL